MTGPFLGDYERAQAHWEAYERTATWTELEAAILGFRMLAVSRLDGPVANGLAVALWSRYEKRGDRTDLNEAIGLLRYATRRFPSDTEHLASFLSNLAGALRLRWRVTGTLADLTESVELSRRVLDATPPRHRWRSARLSNLADALLALYLRHGDTSALDEAVALSRDVVKTADALGEDLVIAKSNLAEVLRLRFESSRDISLLDEAVVLARTAAARAPSPLLQARFTSNLALVLFTRHTATGRREDLREADRLAQQAVRHTPQGHPNWAERANTLAQVRWSALASSGATITAPRRFTRRSRPSAQGLRAGQRLAAATEAAVQATPEGHPSRAAALYRHGLALDFQGDYAAATALWRQVAQGDGFPPGQRVAAARQWAYTELRRADWTSALLPFALAVGLLPHTAPRRVTQADREQALGMFAGLASDAAACAIQVGRSGQAVALLEQGRGVMLGHALDARTELTDLEDRHPDLAQRFAEVRAALDGPHDSSFITRSEADTALTGEQRHALAEEWQTLVETIRSRPGFAGFLHPPSVEEMLEASAGHGPVVMVNVSKLRCDAVLLSGREVIVVPLPGLELADCAQRAARLRLRPSAEIEETLDWLADVVTGPVLRSLGLERTAPQGELPRLWWIPTGPLAALPLHAAGDVPDRVVSSYAPTLRGLISAWTASPLTRGRSDPLIVAVPSAPGVADLPAVELEVADLARRFPHAPILSGAQAVRGTVLDALPQHRWAHFACHATSAADGIEGGLLLWDHVTAPLTVADIARLRLTSAEIAYLSACETNTSPPSLADEALHVAGACHMAGFQHVIGTLWPVRDRIARSTADHFYDALLTPSTPARALHSAVRKMRETSPAALWAAFVHVGA